MMPAVLARASIEGAVLLVLVWTVLRLVPSLPAATRTVLWWCVAAKFLLALVWVTPIELRVLPTVARADGVLSRLAPSTESGGGRATTNVSRSTITGQSAPVTTDWSRFLTGLWVGGLAIAAVVDLRRWKRTRDIIRRSTAAPAETIAAAAELAGTMRLRRSPLVRVSGEVTTPLVAGILRPHVLLPDCGAGVSRPGGMASLSDQQQRMALCHELTHVKRADLWLGIVPAFAERLFFFHPLVRLAAREYSLCREAACDAAVIRTLDTSAQDYGRLLLDLGVSRQRNGLAVAGASSSFSTLKRRIAMLRESSPSTGKRRVMSALVVAVAVVAIAPLRLVARPQAAAAPVQDQAPAWAFDNLSQIWFGPGRAWLSGRLHEGLLSATRSEQKSRDLNYVVLLDDHNVHMSGSLADIDRARRLRRGSERLLWLRRNGAEYVVRDQSLIARVVEIWKPVSELGDAQGELGAKQGLLGTHQGELGTQQGVLGTRQGVLGTRQGEIAATQVVLAERERAARTTAERRAVAEEQRRLELEAAAAAVEMRELDRKMRAFDAPMRELGKQMDVLGAEMDVLSRKMEEASKRAESEMLALVERAIATGIAEPVKLGSGAYVSLIATSGSIRAARRAGQ